jgi:uncharacterized RDD family membrane protein YckC
MDDHRPADLSDDPPPSAGSILSSGPPVTSDPAVTWAPPAPRSASKGASEVAPGIVIAGMGTRLAAFLLDNFVIIALSLVIDVLVRSRIADPALANNLTGTIDGVVGVVYFVVSWRSPWLATPGQRLAGLRVVDADSLGRIDVGRGIVRAVALGWWINFVSLLGLYGNIVVVAFVVSQVVLLGSAVFDRRHQGLHDRWVRTIVVRPAGATSFPLAIGCFLIVLIALAAPFIIATTAGSNMQDWLNHLPVPSPR